MALEGADQNNPCELGEASPSCGFQSICRTFPLLAKTTLITNIERFFEQIMTAEFIFIVSTKQNTYTELNYKRHRVY